MSLPSRSNSNRARTLGVLGILLLAMVLAWRIGFLAGRSVQTPHDIPFPWDEEGLQHCPYVWIEKTPEGTKWRLTHIGLRVAEGRDDVIRNLRAVRGRINEDMRPRPLWIAVVIGNTIGADELANVLSSIRAIGFPDFEIMLHESWQGARALQTAPP